MSQSADHIEGAVATRARALFGVQQSHDGNAAEELTQELGAAIEYLLDHCLRCRLRADWPFWCDGLVNITLEFPGGNALRLIGIAVYGPNGSNWMAPFEGEFELDELHQALQRYEIRFGEADPDGQIVCHEYTQSAPKRDRMLRRRPGERGEWWFVYSMSP